MANYFKDRSVEYPGRFLLTPTGGTNEYDLSRNEGTIYAAGTPLNAEALNGAMQEVIDMIPTNYVDKTTPMLDLDTTAAVGTTDGDLYAAITVLGWASSVIE